MSQTQQQPDGLRQWTLYDVENENTNHFEDRSTAEEKATHAEDDLGLTVEVYPPGEHPDLSDAGPRIEDGAEDVEVIQEGDTPQEDVLGTPRDQLPDDGPSVDEDPLVWMPDEFTDTIDGTVAINRKGFEVLAHHYSIQCETSLCESLTTAERVVFKATARDADGDTYTAFGSAGSARGDDEGLVVELADTRSYKRAISRATGVGMVAVEELQEGVSHE